MAGKSELADSLGRVCRLNHFGGFSVACAPSAVNNCVRIEKMASPATLEIVREVKEAGIQFLPRTISDGLRHTLVIPSYSVTSTNALQGNGLQRTITIANRKILKPVNAE